MLIKVLKSKIHRATVTDAKVEYVGSITVDADLLDTVGIVPGQCVLVSDLANGQRFETYAITGKPGSGTICVNGAAARLVAVGDEVIIMAFGYVDADKPAPKPVIAIVDGDNKLVREM